MNTIVENGSDEIGVLRGSWGDSLKWVFRLTDDEALVDRSQVKEVVCIPVLNASVVLVKTRRNVWEVPGGHIEAGESWIQTARREVQEESGYLVSGIKFIGFLTFNYRSGAQKQAPCFVGRVLPGDVSPRDSDEIEQVKIVPFKELESAALNKIVERQFMEILKLALL